MATSVLFVASIFCVLMTGVFESVDGAEIGKATQLLDSLKPETTAVQGQLAAGVCGGGCVLSNQCANYAGGDNNCRCTWFSCKQY